jgi:hypothetical protein
MNNYIYKIRNKVTGLYSDGGKWPTFKKNGKAYRSKEAITNWFNSARSLHGKFLNCEIVEFEIREVQTFELIERN